MCDDVKIKKDSSPEEEYHQELVETESIVAMLYNQKQNGNIDRARSLGRKMAEQVDADDGEFLSLIHISESAPWVYEMELQEPYRICTEISATNHLWENKSEYWKNIEKIM